MMSDQVEAQLDTSQAFAEETEAIRKCKREESIKLMLCKSESQAIAVILIELFRYASLLYGRAAKADLCKVIIQHLIVIF